MSLRIHLRTVLVWAGAVLVLAFAGSGIARAQELTPRAYWPAPTKTNVLIFGYAYSTGDVVVDPTLPVVGTDTQNNFLQFGYQRAFGLAGRSASLLISVPYVWGTTRAAVSDGLSELEGTRNISALSDTRIRLSVNLLGAPAMDPPAFQELRRNPKPILGTSVQLSVPTGEFESDKIINAGTDRWALKADLGYIHPIRPTWIAEVDLGVWFFTDNELLGLTREQDPMVTGEFHLIKRFRPGFWASFDMNFYRGGQTTIAGELNANLQRNSRVGATLVYPFRPGHAIKGTFSTGVVTQSGGDYTSVQVNYLFIWR